MTHSSGPGGPKSLGGKVRLALGIVLAIYSVLFIVLNASYQSNVWLMVGQEHRVPTLVVIVVTAALTLATAWLLRTGLGRWIVRRAGKRTR